MSVSSYSFGKLNDVVFLHMEILRLRISMVYLIMDGYYREEGENYVNYHEENKNNTLTRLYQ